MSIRFSMTIVSALQVLNLKAICLLGMLLALLLQMMLSYWMMILTLNRSENLGKSFPSWRRKFYALCDSRGYNDYVLRPRAPPPNAPAQKWKEEYDRLMKELEMLTAGLDGDTGSWKSEQELLALRQSRSESTASFLNRFETTVADLASHGVVLDNGRLVAALLSSLRQDVKEVAVDRMANAGGRLSYSQLATTLVMRERMITGPKDGSRGGSGKVNSVSESGGDASRRTPSKKICYSWRRSGKCRFGKSCKFAHIDPSEDRPKPRDPEQRPAVTTSQASPVSSSPVSVGVPQVNSEAVDPSKTVEITQRLLNIADNDPDTCAVSKAKEKLAGPMVNIPLEKDKVLPALLDTGAYYNYISASLVEKLGLGTSSRGVSESLRVTLADGSVRHVLAVVDVGNVQFRVIQGGRSKNAILGVRSMCDCGATLSFGVNSDSERSVAVRGELRQLTTSSGPQADPVNAVDEYIDDGLSGLYQVEDGDDANSVLSQIADTPGFVVSGGVLNHPSREGQSVSIDTNGWLPVKGAEDYRWRMRRLLPTEEKDVPEQIYCAE
ncbi:hypothetical protein FOZ62_004263, partial [Perkinsus olseni]